MRFASRAYPVLFGEQNPRDWWTAVCDCIREVAAGEVLAAGATGHISSLTFVDKSGAPLRPAIGFQDQRAVEEVQELSNAFSREELASQLGIDLPPAATWPLPRLMWLRKHEPATLERAHYCLQAKDYVNFRLTGQFASDASSNRGLVDLNTGRLAGDVFAALGLPADLLPPIFGPEETIGTVTASAAAETGLAAGTPVVAGWNDLNTAVLGSGSPPLFNITGTSEHVGAVTQTARHSPQLTCAPFLPGNWLYYGVTSCGGGSLEWFSRAFETPVEELLGLAGAAPAGSDSLFFLPYLQGERAPIWDGQASGAFIGIRTHHDRRHFARAILEGVAFSLRQILDLVQSPGGQIRVSGGAARSPLWNRIKADVFGREVAILENTHTGVCGAAMLAAVGAGEYADAGAAARCMNKVATAFAPSHAALYEELYQRYCGLYPALRNWYA